MGGRRYDYTYNAAGWLTHQQSTAGQNIDYSYFHNGFQKSITDNAINSLTEYQYDVNGNKIGEKFSNTVTGEVFQDTTVTYDELNRVSYVADTDFTISYRYDELGNRIRVKGQYRDLQNSSVFHEQDYWYGKRSTNHVLFTVSLIC